MTLNIATVKYAMCFYMKFFKKYSRFYPALAGGLGGIWGLFEKMRRRQEMAMFLVPKALETSGRYLDSRGIIKYFPFLEVIISFSCSFN